MLQLVALGLVLFPPLEDLERFLFERGLAGAVAHFGQAGLVGAEFGVEFGEFDVEGFDVGVGVGDGGREGGFWGCGFGAEEAVHGGECWLYG